MYILFISRVIVYWMITQLRQGKSQVTFWHTTIPIHASRQFGIVLRKKGKTFVFISSPANTVRPHPFLYLKEQLAGWPLLPCSYETLFKAYYLVLLIRCHHSACSTRPIPVFHGLICYSTLGMWTSTHNHCNMLVTHQKPNSSLSLFTHQLNVCNNVSMLSNPCMSLVSSTPTGSQLHIFATSRLVFWSHIWKQGKSKANII